MLANISEGRDYNSLLLMLNVQNLEKISNLKDSFLMEQFDRSAGHR